MSQAEFTAGGNLSLNPKINHVQLGGENVQVKGSTQELGGEFKGAQSKGPEGANCVIWVPIHPRLSHSLSFPHWQWQSPSSSEKQGKSILK